MERRKTNILVVFANPRGSDQLRLGAEDKAIRESIRRSRYRDNISITVCHAATVHDLRRALLDEALQVVHISGHGTSNGLVLEDETGKPYLVPPQAVAELLEAYPSIRCVILNACYSLAQGELIGMGVPFTIAMESTIDDDAAVEFSRGFYDALGAGRDIEFAYQEGCRTVKLAAPATRFESRIIKAQRAGRGRRGEANVSPATDTWSGTLQVQFPNALVYTFVPVHRKLRIGRIELKNNGQRAIPAGWRGKIGLLRPVDFRVTLVDTIVLPGMPPGVLIPIGPFSADVPQDIVRSKDAWHWELYVIDPAGNEELLFRSAGITFA